MHKFTGGCHCGNIAVDFELASAAAEYHPRACDCDFCCKHGAAWLSDANGSLLIRIKEPRESNTYRQGSGQAELLLCRNCGVLAAVVHRSNGKLHAAVNVRAVEGAARFGVARPVSPQSLSPDQKVTRWHDIWFSSVEIRDGECAADSP
jgi:hypothetical protein